MSWNVEFLEPEGVIELVVNDSVSSHDVRQATDAALSLVESRQCYSVLLNCLELTQAPTPSVVQRLPEYYAARGIDTRLRIGLVNSGSPNGLEVSQFYKLVAKQKNYTVQLFESRDAALQWLQE